MRLVTYLAENGWRSGIRDGNVIVDTEELIRAADMKPVEGTGNRQVLREGTEFLSDLGNARHGGCSTVLASEVRLGPPVPDPDKVICVGLNYRDHAVETGLATADVPPLFTKFRNSLIGAEAPIVLPRISKEVDYEAELAIVIGRTAKEVPVGAALSHVAGAMCFNDVSARDLQFKTSQFTAGKALDTFGPCGPELVTLDEIADLQRLRICARVNGHVVQESTTSEMIFTVKELVAYVSEIMTLEPGDIVATGTPAGVGFARKPPSYLEVGDRVEVEIEGLGILGNTVRATAESW